MKYLAVPIGKAVSFVHPSGSILRLHSFLNIDWPPDRFLLCVRLCVELARSSEQVERQKQSATGYVLRRFKPVNWLSDTAR